MPAVIVDIAEAMVEELNGHDFGMEFIAQRSYADIREIFERITPLRVDVCPWNMEPDLDTVGSVDYPCQVDILIRERFEKQEQDTDGTIFLEEIDKRVQLLQDMYEFFMPCQPSQSGRQLTSLPDAAWIATRVIATYVRPHLAVYRQYTGWLRVTYSMSREF